MVAAPPLGRAPGRWHRPRRGDLVAGASVALVLVPQALAYAELAGLPAEHGLAMAAVAPLAAALAASSPYLQTGPVALTSLLTLGALAPLAATGSPRYVALAALLALLVGAVRVAVGLLRLGAVAYLMSQPVVAAFVVAGAVLIVCSQVPNLLGLAPVSANPIVAAASAGSHPGSWDLAAAVFGTATVAAVLLGRRASPLFPTVLVVTAAATAVSALTGYGGRVVGGVPGGLPRLRVELPWSASFALLLPAVVIAIVGFAEPAAIARRYAAAERRHWDPDREFVGQGLANLAAGLAGGFPAGGSLSRSALNRAAGATSRWSGAVTGLVVLLLLPLVGLLSPLPKAVLAGLVIAPLLSLVEARPFRELWRMSRIQFTVASLTFVATLVLAPRIERAVLLGVALALGVHLWRELAMHVDTAVSDRVLHVWPRGVLYFASAPVLERHIVEVLADHPEAEQVVLHLSGLGRMDLTGMFMLRSLFTQAAEDGVRVTLEDVPPSAWRLLHRVLPDHVTDDEPAGAEPDADG